MIDPITRELQTGVDVLRLEFGIVCEDLIARHRGRQEVEHVDDADPHAANAGAAAALPWIDRDAICEVCHKSSQNRCSKLTLPTAARPAILGRLSDRRRPSDEAEAEFRKKS